jgi:hypothetical protein
VDHISVVVVRFWVLVVDNSVVVVKLLVEVDGPSVVVTFEESVVVEGTGVVVLPGGLVPPSHSGTFTAKSQMPRRGLKKVPGGHNRSEATPSRQR